MVSVQKYSFQKPSSYNVFFSPSFRAIGVIYYHLLTGYLPWKSLMDFYPVRNTQSIFVKDDFKNLSKSDLTMLNIILEELPNDRPSLADIKATQWYWDLDGRKCPWV